MSKKKLDLGTTFDATIKKSKTPKKTIAAPDVQDVQDVDGYGHTQGSRSGARMKRINITLLPDNREFLETSARLAKTSMAKYFNYILNSVQEVQDVDGDYKVMLPNSKRINMAFSDRNYEFVREKAAENNVSPSSLINQLIEQRRAG